jgi:hypothetical protein
MPPRERASNQGASLVECSEKHRLDNHHRRFDVQALNDVELIMDIDLLFDLSIYELCQNAVPSA